MIKNYLVLTILFCVFFIETNAQLSMPFYNYLEKNNFKREQETYIRTISKTSNFDSINYLKARFYLQYYNDSLFFESYTNSKALILNDTTTFIKANIQFLKSSSEQQTKWFQSIKNDSLKNLSNQIRYIYNASLSPLNFNVNSFPAPLATSFLNYQKSYIKKGIVAGSLSAIIPGLGKLYTGRKKSFIATFLVSGILAAQTYESIKKLGPTHPFSIFSMGVFGVFYLSNIYGSYNDVKQIKEENKIQFQQNAADYYNSIFIKN